MNIIESIYKEPEKWTQREYFFEHKDGLKVWTANGFFFYNTDPAGSVSLIWKFKFLKAHMWWTINQPITKQNYEKETKQEI